MSACLGLGTVQFGMHYGISNDRGQPAEAEIAAILAGAADLGIGYLDTAFAYPNSETLIGRHLPPRHSFRIVTKTPPLGDAPVRRETKTEILDAVAQSMDRLRTDRLHGLLLHRAADLARPGWEIIVEALDEVKTRGWAGLVGASVYGDKELQLVESRFTPGLVQAPFNVLDTRLLLSPVFRRLKSAGAEVHARSVFLQGLLLMQPSALPTFFAPLQATLASLRASWAEAGCDPLAACLGHVMGLSDIDVAVVGVNSLAELREIHQAAARGAGRTNAAASIGQGIDAKYLDPSRWPSPLRH